MTAEKLLALIERDENAAVNALVALEGAALTIADTALVVSLGVVARENRERGLTPVLSPTNLNRARWLLRKHIDTLTTMAAARRKAA